MKDKPQREDTGLRQAVADAGGRGRRAAECKDGPIRWHLLQVMTDRGIRFSVDLKHRLDAVGIKLSAQHVNRLVAKAPDRLSIKILVGLCRALDCEPGDLLKISMDKNSKYQTGGE